MTVDSLIHNEHLQEIYLVGNPCADWHGYRQFVIAKLPQLKKLVGPLLTSHHHMKEVSHNYAKSILNSSIVHFTDVIHLSFPRMGRRSNHPRG